MKEPKCTFLLVVTLASMGLSEAIQMAPLPPEDLMHRVTLDQMGKYALLWTPREDDILFELQVATSGYVGFGFSPNGGMKGADIITGWVDDDTGEVYLYDHYATGNAIPKVDQSNDVILLGGYQNDSHTMLRFTRLWNTCDQEEDMEISDDTVRVIWAYSDQEPKDGDPAGITYHADLRGTRSLYFNEPTLQLPEFGDDVQIWDVRSPNVELPDNLTTLYWCKIFKMPPLEVKTHVIGYVPLISEDNIQHVHHILLYECHLPESHKHFEKWLDIDGAQCFGANMPPSWKYCGTPFVAWAIGGEGDIYPDQVGIPMGEEHGGATYFMMEMHYDNPNLRKGIVDNSGVRIFYTENLRRYDGSILIVGHEVSPTQIIPPGQEWMSVGYCSSDCTREVFPEDGTYLLNGLLHSHLLGVNLTVRHIRDGVELPILMKDNNYDFNFQETRKFKEEILLKPGDTLITECGYDSRKRDVATFGGFGTKEEMCLAFFFYYPRSNLAVCSSGPKMTNIFQAFGIEEIEPLGKGMFNAFAGSEIDEEAETELAEGIKSGNVADNLMSVDMVQMFRGVVIKAPQKYENMTLYDLVTSADTWKDEALIRNLQDIVVNGDHTASCNLKVESRTLGKNETIMSYPEFRPLPPEENTCSGNFGQDGISNRGGNSGQNGNSDQGGNSINFGQSDNSGQDNNSNQGGNSDQSINFGQSGNSNQGSNTNEGDNFGQGGSSNQGGVISEVENSNQEGNSNQDSNSAQDGNSGQESNYGQDGNSGQESNYGQDGNSAQDGNSNDDGNSQQVDNSNQNGNSAEDGNSNQDGNSAQDGNSGQDSNYGEDGNSAQEKYKPLKCPEKYPNCNQYPVHNKVLGHLPSYF